jgi:hypothetical protein
MYRPQPYPHRATLYGVNASTDDGQKSLRVTRKPQEGGGISEHRKAFLDKYADFKEPVTLFHEEDAPKGMPGVFQIHEVDTRFEEDFVARSKGVTDPPAIQKLILTWVLMDETGKNPVMAKTDDGKEKPLAIEYKIKYPKETLSWDNFIRTNFYALVDSLGYEIQQEDLDYDYSDLKGLYGVFDVVLNPSKKDPNIKFSNIKTKSSGCPIKQPGSLNLGKDVANELRAFNKEQLAVMFKKD